jgi:hypothetical protein
MFMRVTKDVPAKIGTAVANDARSTSPKAKAANNQVSDLDLAKIPQYTELKMRLHQRLLDMINLSVIDKMEPEEFRKEIGEMVRELLLEENKPLNLSEQSQLVDDILDELLGLGPIEPLLKDNSVTDILINTHSQVFVERSGKLELTTAAFKDDRHLLRIIDRIVSAVGRRVDESQPMVDARLADGSRVNAIIPPLAVDGPLLSIRKFARVPFNMSTLVEVGTLPEEFAELLEAIVRARRNVLISGGTGSGKTTLLNAMSAYIDPRERIVTIEDAAELQLQQIHVGRLETRPANNDHPRQFMPRFTQQGGANGRHGGRGYARAYSARSDSIGLTCSSPVAAHERWNTSYDQHGGDHWPRKRCRHHA